MRVCHGLCASDIYILLAVFFVEQPRTLRHPSEACIRLGVLEHVDVLATKRSLSQEGS